RFPGCNRPVRWTDAHHIKYWEHGGPTDYDNLLLLCRRHHTYVHSQLLDLTLLPGATAHFTWTDGRERTSHPRGAPPTRPPG
ncbi:MAG TPA: HNH endonuclease signature motif containing protein, partial [Ilumatobacteraceae bacterium]|nr:HNH endonuclease signature motif containing protein [Ilumatobacteraceae bacterium]